MAAAWSGLDGPCASDDEEATIGAQFGEYAASYGEATLEGTRAILDALDLTTLPQAAPDCVFVDLGSGVGKMVAQAALEYAVSRSIGVELCESRHVRALLACERLLASLDEPPAVAIELRLGDMMQADEALAAATHVYLSSLLFSPNTMLKLAVLLDSAPNLRMVASLQRFPPSSKWNFVKRAAKVRAQMSWVDSDKEDAGLEIHVYCRPAWCSAVPSDGAPSSP